MPWSEKAQTLLSRQYAPVGRAGHNGLSAAIEALQKVCERPNRPFEVEASASGQNVDPHELLNRFCEKEKAIDGYMPIYRMLDCLKNTTWAFTSTLTLSGIRKHR